MGRVAIVIGSSKDRGAMEGATRMLEAFSVPFDVEVLSAHRQPDAVFDFAAGAVERGYSIIIAGAGKAAHLAGLMAAKTTLPVIGVPLSASLQGLDALLSTVQMPTGVPGATAQVGKDANGALLF